jgi:excisionase family DNA binding protein
MNPFVTEVNPQPQEDDVSAALLDVKAVSAMLTCSARHVYRLADAGLMPRPVKLGALVRWRRNELTEWLAAGCPRIRPLTRPR